MAERDILAKAMLALSRGPLRLFRNNVGVGWVGKTVARTGGTLTLKDARPLHSGLCPGSSDTIGWFSLDITPAMVGRRVAIFTSVEFKDRTQPTEEQTRFIEAVRRSGGIAGIAHSTTEAQGIIDGYLTALSCGGKIPTSGGSSHG